MYYDQIGYSVRKNADKIDVNFRRTGTLMSMGSPCFISKLKFSYDEYSVDKVWTKIYCHFYFRRITLKTNNVWWVHIRQTMLLKKVKTWGPTETFL